MIHLTYDSADKGQGLLQFIGSLVGSLAWPIAAIVIVLVLRKPLIGLLSNLDTLSWGDKKATFKALNKAEMDLVDIEVNPESRPKPNTIAADHGLAFDEMPPSLSDKKQLADAAALLELTSVAATAPSLAVLDGWQLVQSAIEKVAAKHRLGSAQGYDRTFEVARNLHTRGVFNNQIMVFLAELRKVRNQAAHARGVDTSDALRFLDLVKRFIRIIEDL